MSTKLSAALFGLGLLLTSNSALASEPEAEDSVLNDPERPFALRLHAEVGFLAQLSHSLQLGADGTNADVRKDYGQDTLFPYTRWSADFDLGRKRRHTVALLYQPLDLRSENVAPRDLVIEGDTIAAGTPLRFRYGFSYWRASWMYDLLKDERELAFGLGLQIRNANLEIFSQDGTQGTATRDVGPVPLLKFRGRGTVYQRFWMGGEIDGFYAPIRYINGSDSDVEGAIVDASLRFGREFRGGVDGYLNLRWIGGGAQGTSSKPEPFTDGFTKNWLHFWTVGLGVSLR